MATATKVARAAALACSVAKAEFSTATASLSAAGAPTVSKFEPRRTFPVLDSLPRSYFLGHHRAGLEQMKSLISSVDLIIECRDYRIPLTSRNPLFESSLAGKRRLNVYTKRDLGGWDETGGTRV